MKGRVEVDAPGAVANPLFATTQWSIVLAAANQEAPGAAAALEKLCGIYWYPLYAYVRHRGYSPEDAKDLTQGFFQQLLCKNCLSAVHPCKGRFRSFLQASMNHFLANEWDRQRTLKRGGGLTFVPFDELLAERRYQLEPAGGGSPDQLYERTWALALLKEVLGRLRDDLLEAGRSRHFEELKIFLTGERPATSYAELATRLACSESALRKEVQRLRLRYAELLREEIGRTVANPAEVEEEFHHLYAVVSN